MNTEKTVSILIPAWNSADFLGRTLDAALNQTYSNTEIIIVDDGSTDTTYEVAMEYAVANDKVKVFRLTENKGVSSARNHALSKSKGYYIAPLDSDDIWHPQKIEAQVKEMESGPYGMVYVWRVNIDKNMIVIGEPREEHSSGNIFSDLMKRNFIGGGSSPLIKREAIVHVGCYDEDLKGCEDYYLYLNLCWHFPASVVKKRYLGYSVRADSLSRDIVQRNKCRKLLQKKISSYPLMESDRTILKINIERDRLHQETKLMTFPTVRRFVYIAIITARFFRSGEYWEIVQSRIYNKFTYIIQSSVFRRRTLSDEYSIHISEYFKNI